MAERPQELDEHEFVQDDNDDQSWYWSVEWQTGERQADHDIETGQVFTYESEEEFLASLSSREQLLAILERAPDVEPDPEDRLP